MTWTQKNDDLLIATRGRLTYSEIGKIIGKSRGAIAGRAFRLNLPVLAVQKIARERGEPLSRNLTIHQLTIHTCRHKTSGEGISAHYCGHAVYSDGMCRFHCSN